MLLAKEGVATGLLKPYAQTSISALIAAEARGGYVRKGAEWIKGLTAGSERHHVFPQLYRKDFTRAFGKDVIDNWTLPMPLHYHQFRHYTLKWNRQWDAFFKCYPNRNPGSWAVLRQYRTMMRESGLEHVMHFCLPVFHQKLQKQEISQTCRALFPVMKLKQEPKPL